MRRQVEFILLFLPMIFPCFIALGQTPIPSPGASCLGAISVECGDTLPPPGDLCDDVTSCSELENPVAAWYKVHVPAYTQLVFDFDTDNESAKSIALWETCSTETQCEISYFVDVELVRDNNTASAVYWRILLNADETIESISFSCGSLFTPIPTLTPTITPTPTRTPRPTPGPNVINQAVYFIGRDQPSYFYPGLWYFDRNSNSFKWYNGTAWYELALTTPVPTTTP